VTIFSSARLGVLFRQRAQLTGDLRHAHAKTERLTLEHNELVRKAGQAATDGGRQRAQLQASRKGEEAARARGHADALSRHPHEKETEIADLIGALWAASQSLLSADTIRQLNDHLGARRHSSPMRPSEYTARCTTPRLVTSPRPSIRVSRSATPSSAFHQACATIADEPDRVMPQLFVRHGIDPHTVVLVRPEVEEGGTP
jgi:hypothetical protein